MTQKNNREFFFVMDVVWVKGIIDEHLKGLSPTQQQQAMEYLKDNKEKLYQGFDEGVRLILDEWSKKQNTK